MKLAAEAIDRFEQEIFIAEALRSQFPQQLDREEIVRSLSPFSSFAMTRAALILSLGDKVAREMLVALGYKNYLTELDEPAKEPSKKTK